MGPGTLLGNTGVDVARTCVQHSADHDKKCLVAEDVRWAVLHTRPRQEKAVARSLEATRQTCYLPLIDRVSYSRGRKVYSRVPLFAGYVFAFGGADVAYTATACKRVCQVIPVLDQKTFIFELDQIRGALSQGGELELYPFAVVGKRVRVVRGPFFGLEGTIIERKATTRLVLHVGILGRGASMEIDIDFVEPIS